MNKAIDQVSPKQLSTHLAAAESAPLLLDVRTPLEFQEVNMSGARLLPLDQLDAADLIQHHGADKECVVICRSGGRAAKAADKLARAGMSNLKILEGGMQAWEQCGLPVNRGKNVMSLERQVRIAAGSLVLAGVALGTTVHPGFFGLSAFVGAGLVFAGITDWCGMGLLLAKAPWNQVSGSAKNATSCCR